ncbi:MAG: helix-turn-helix transcriptional regulator [Hyphomicrobiales bacterium]
MKDPAQPDAVVSRAAARLLVPLRNRGPMTAGEIAAVLGIGQVATRVHLRALEATGFVARTEERRPVGRPVARYHLTPRAEDRFPKAYDRLAAHLVEAIVAEGGTDALERILARWEDRLHATLDASLPDEPRARLDALCAHQNQHGFMASVRSDASGVVLVERNCPVLAIASLHPEICRHEAALFGRTLRWKTALESCQATGDVACVFRIGRAPAKGSAARPAGATDGKE